MNSQIVPMRSLRPLVFFIAALASLLWTHSVGANPPAVTSNADNAGNLNTLRAAIAAAADGDTITFDASLNGNTITLVQGELVIDKNLTITGPADCSLAIIGGNVNNPLASRVFHVTQPQGNDLRTFQISGLQIQGSVTGANGAAGTGLAPNGAAGSPPTPVVGQLPPRGGGGGILCELTTKLIVTNCYFLNCHATGGSGGNAYSNSGLGNGGDGAGACGGAIYSLGDSYLTDCTFYGNTANGGNGGGGAQGGAGGSGASAAGGAVTIGYHNETNLKILNCTFFNNSVIGGNGGNGGNGYVSLTQALPSDGGAGGDAGQAIGGALEVWVAVEPPTGMDHSTVYQNYCTAGTAGTGGAGFHGGNNGANGQASDARGCGLYLDNKKPPVSNTIFAGNSCTASWQPVLGPDVFGPVDSTGFNLVGTTDANSSGWQTGSGGHDLLGMITTTFPINPVLGSFQINGTGDMPTLAPITGSPAIDAGTQGKMVTDQNGQARPIVFSGIVNGGDGSDIGAVELISDYTSWCQSFGPGFVDTAPGDDPDHDGMTNQQEYAFGTDPTSGASFSKITAGIDSTGSLTFTYARRDPALSGLVYKVFTSTDLQSWVEDAGATQVASAPNANHVETVTVTLSFVPSGGKLFVRMQAQ